MKALLTYEIHNCDEDLVDHVSFHFDAEDLAKWREAADACETLGATSVSFPDYRCAFFEENGDPINFRADACSVAVFGNQGGAEFIRFLGYEKHSETGREWYTERIYLSELSSALSEAADSANSKETAE